MRADAIAKRSDIVRAASQLFATHGQDVSMRQIAQAAGVGIGTLYRHFPERRDLVLGIFDDIAQQISDLSADALDHWDADPATAWAEFVRGCGALRTGAIATATNAPEALAGDGMTDFTKRRDRLMQDLTPVLERARSQALVEPTLTPPQFILGLGAITRPLPAPAAKVMPREQMQAWMIEIYLRGLRPESP